MPTSEYYSQPRHDIAELVPREAQRVLDVGCGFGALGGVLMSRSPCEVHGIERNPAAEAQLRQHYARYIIGDVETSVGAFKGERYDCIVFADILEHLVDPWRVLRHFSALLTPDGCVVASIPNIRNGGIIANLLLRGRWRYVDSGILDSTHLRFFTRLEIVDLFSQAGLLVEKVVGKRDRHSLRLAVALALPILFVPELAICQFLVRARRPFE